MMNKVSVKDFIIKAAIDDKSQKELFAILFSRDSFIDKRRLLSFLAEKVNNDAEKISADKVVIDEVLTELKKNRLHYDIFLTELKNALNRQIRESLGYERLEDGAYDTLSPEVFWPMMVVAMKKCLGPKNARVSITDRKQYFNYISEELNPAQKKVHNKCIDYFANNADDFSISTNLELRKYLHPFHSKNKKIKTQKKNLNRVEKRINKIMQVYKISHDRIEVNIFSKGRYIVPCQFASYIKKVHLN